MLNQSETSAQFADRVMRNLLDWVDNHQRMHRVQKMAFDKTREFRKTKYLYRGGFASKEDVQSSFRALSKVHELLRDCRRFDAQFSILTSQPIQE